MSNCTVSLRSPISPRLWTLLSALFVLVLSSGAFARASAAAAPVLDLNGMAAGIDFVATFSEDGGPQLIVDSTALAIAYPDGTQLTAAKARLSARPDGALESLAADPGATGLTVKYDAAKGELTLKGTRPVADYQQVLRTLTYNNTSQSPDTTDRLVEMTVSDNTLTSLPAIGTVLINAVNDAPVLDNSGDMSLPSINEDDVNSSGASVKAIIDSAQQHGEDRITDVDRDALEGMAIIEATSGNGTWQYSVTAGATWLTFPAVSNTSAVLLNEMSRIRFVPAPGYSGSASFAFRAWDQSAGRENGQTGIDVSLNGGTTAFSAQSETVTIEVLPVNDLPIVDLNGPEEGTGFSPQFFEGGPPVAIADSDATISDADHASLASLSVTLTNRPSGAAEGLAATTTGTSIIVTAYDPATGRLLLGGPDSVAAFQQVLRTVTYQNSSTQPGTSARLIEVVANDGVNMGNVAVRTVRVNPTNNAPVLNAPAPLSLGAVAEDSAQPAGMSIAMLLATAGDPITDADESALEGIAVVAADSSHGSWQSSLANPPLGETDWQPVGVVSPTMALLLPDTAWLRFVPAANYAGPSGNMTFRAWDQTVGTAGQRVDASQTGGSSAFSTATGVIVATVTPLNDPPALLGLPATALLYIEDANPTRLMTGVVVVDVDSSALVGATVRLTNPIDGDAEQLAAVPGSTGIAAAYDDGVLQLSGVASPAAYQQVLRSVTYRNTSQDPDATPRIPTVTVADALADSPAYTLTVQVQPVNDAPTLDLDSSHAGNDSEAVFYINRAPVLLAPGLVLADSDNTNLKSVTVRIVNLKNRQAELLSADISSAAYIKTSYDPATGVLSLTGMDSIVNYQQVLRSITYDNILPQPDMEDRRVEFIVSDSETTSEPRVAVVQLLPAPAVRLLMPMISRRAEEPNDACIDAYAIMVNRTESFLPDDNVDWFIFDLLVAANVSVELRGFSPGRGQLNVATGSACQQLQLIGTAGEPTSDKTVNLGRREAGRYYIRVIADGPLSATAAYTLFVRATSP